MDGRALMVYPHDPLLCRSWRQHRLTIGGVSNLYNLMRHVPIHAPFGQKIPPVRFEVRGVRETFGMGGAGHIFPTLIFLDRSPAHVDKIFSV